MNVHADQDILQRRQIAKQADGLIGAIDARGGHPVRREPVDALAGEPDLPVVRRVELHDAVEHRGLAGAVRADDRMDRAVLNLELEAVDGDQAAEALGHLFGPEQHGAGHERFSASWACGTATASRSVSSSRSLAFEGHRPSGLSRITAMIARP